MINNTFYSWDFVPNEIYSLVTLVRDLRWTWSHSSDKLWRWIDPEIWEVTKNPWLLLQHTSRKKLRELANDPTFRAELAEQVAQRERYLARPGWFGGRYQDQLAEGIAYFCMEFGLSEALPIYAGGLGILAGDILKTSSDLGVPLFGVGLLYQQGYFRQIIDFSGYQHEAYPYNDPMSLPIMPAMDEQGNWLIISVPLPGRGLRVRVWEALVGKTKLYLLDSNDPLNSATDRGITSELYGGDNELRLLQEIVLGIGGMRALAELGLAPAILHLNEGHVAFAALERIAQTMQTHMLSFEEALWACRPSTIFTTHTPVPAGFDHFSPELMHLYFRDYAHELDLSFTDLLRLGQKNQQGNFFMAYLALNTSGAIHGVSKVHGITSRKIFSPLFPRYPIAEVPVGHVTNGVHAPSWDSQSADTLWTKIYGKARWLGDLKETAARLYDVPDEEIWAFLSEGRRQTICYIRQRLVRFLKQQGAPLHLIHQASAILDPNTLTLGFSRRFTEYKRPNLILHDKERFMRILTDADRPVQLIVAGKAHPQDEIGKALIHEIVTFAMDHRVYGKVIFIPDYDMAIAEELVQGVDLWINTPRKPMEASGTSGMKLLVNGGLNCSVLDGWWAEAYEKDVGWAIGNNHFANDAEEANALYDILEQEVIPEFYTRNADGVPQAWIKRVKASMAQLTERFSTNRMLREYLEMFYLPGAERSAKRLADGAALAKSLKKWAEIVDVHWSHLYFGNISVEDDEDNSYRFLVQAYLDDLKPEMVRLELYADPLQDDGRPFRQEMAIQGLLAGAINGYVFEAKVPKDRPASDYTPRMIPKHEEMSLPLELPLIRWQR